MSFSAIHLFIGGILTRVPWWHWLVFGILSIIVSLWVRKKSPVYGAISLGFSAFIGLFLLDVAVASRVLNNLSIDKGISVTAEWQRLLHAGEALKIQLLSNFIVFIPFGFFLSEFLASSKRFSAWRIIGFATLAGFGLSMCIECLQLVLRVGFFEVTDLVMNTLGAFVGAGVAVLIRRFLHSLTLGRNDNKEIPSLRSE